MILKSGPFALDTDAQSLTARGAPVALSAQPFAILALLMAAPGRIVTRAELKQALWPNSERIDTERRLNTAMRALREALEDTAETPRFIETVRGRGYRWMGEQLQEPRPAPRWPIVAAAAGTICAVLLGAALAPSTPAPPTPEQRGRFVAIAASAAHTPAEAAAALDTLVRERPDFAAAQTLRAQLAVQGWRAAPTPATLTRSHAVLAEARAAAGDSAGLDTLRAELTLLSERDWVGSERIYRHALAREPGNADARRGLAWLLLNAGRPDAALAEVQTLMTSADLSDSMRADLGWLLLRMRRTDLALSLCADGDAQALNLLACRHTALARTGDTAAARDVALTLMQQLDASPGDLARVRNADAGEGYQRFLHWRLAHFPLNDGHWFQRAQLQAEAGELDAALASLEHAYANGDPSLFKLTTTPEFDALRASPRFEALLRAVQAPSP